MPTVSLTISDTNQSVFRPIVLGVVENIKTLTRMDSKIPVFIVNHSGQLQSAGSTLDERGDREARMETQRRITITAEENYAEDQHVTDIYGTRNSIPFFSDRELKVEIRPAYATSTVTLQFRYDTRSEEEARRWRNDVSAKYIQNRTSFMHKLQYCYTAPNPVWELIIELWSKREARAGFGDNLRTYVNKCTTNALTLIGDDAGENIQLAITENQSRVQGFFDFTTNPEKPQVDQEKGIWSISFNYTFTYQRPIAVEMMYPIMVHNQLLDPVFTDFINTAPKIEDSDPQRTLFLESIEDMESENALNSIKPLVPFVKLPYIDDTILYGTFPYTGSILHAILSQEEATDRFAYNMSELGEVELDPDVLEFIRESEYPYMSYPGKSVLYLEAFRNGQPMTPPSVGVDRHLDVRMTCDIDLRKIYHIRFAVFTDLNYVTQDAIDRLRNYPKAFVKIISAINQLLLVRPEFQNVGNQNVVHKWQYDKVWDILTGGNTGISTGGSKWPPGKPGSWTGNKDWLSQIPPDLVKWWRANRKGHMTVQTLYVSTSLDRWRKHQLLLERMKAKNRS